MTGDTNLALPLMFVNSIDRRTLRVKDIIHYYCKQHRNDMTPETRRIICT